MIMMNSGASLRINDISNNILSNVEQTFNNFSTHDDDDMYARFIEDLALIDTSNSTSASIENELCNAMNTINLTDRTESKNDGQATSIVHPSTTTTTALKVYNDYYTMNGNTFSPKRNLEGSNRSTKMNHTLLSSMPEVILTDRDVLVMRGYFASNRPANLKYREIIHSKKESYYSADRKTKTDITWEVINEVEKSLKGGRFVKLVSPQNKYVCVPPRVMRRKVAQAFRDIHRRESK